MHSIETVLSTLYHSIEMNMVKKYLIIAGVVLTTFINGCSQNVRPGYRFDLFKNTPNWKLAQAVEKEDEGEMKAILKSTNIDINFQEPRFGNTLLHLAIGNDKLVSTRVLLEKGANVNIGDSENSHAIHEATKSPELRKHSFEILKLLIEHGANVNDTLIKTNSKKDTTYFYVPLMGASLDFNCAKLLLENGANPYVKKDSNYVVWSSVLILDAKPFETIYVARYMIVEKKMPIPNPIFYTADRHKPKDVLFLINKFNTYNDTNKESLKKEVLDYLKQIDFPRNGLYIDHNKFLE